MSKGSINHHVYIPKDCIELEHNIVKDKTNWLDYLMIPDHLVKDSLQKKPRLHPSLIFSSECKVVCRVSRAWYMLSLK